MKTIFDKSIRDELIERIGHVNESSKSEWGKMNVSQMLAHCVQWEEMALSKRIYKQSFLGKLFGKKALKGFIKDETPFRRNVPTVPEFRIKETNGNVEELKKKWINLMKEYEQFGDSSFVHPFFGRMTREQVGILAYKHSDHHLRQFNA
ncbi:DUF1569 domain-containing protein [Pinibacter soli]|uniref:DUF1569 domain-containing protein n=1 Tax=Pinibacter soli TaxID=3044211 RepID=A0ABT6RDH8_9BACT|nr:DUF1569 domain-containing protein [Pinibacter soli]MDI3320630.1 DUF1569 domain-containing protein [Pinibacter soli]